MAAFMDVLASDIVGFFKRDEGLIVRIKQPDRTFLEGKLAPEDFAEFSDRWRTAMKNDDGSPFDISALTNLQVTE